MKKTFLSLGFALLALTMTVGCGGKSDKEQGEEETASQAVSPTAQTAPAVAPLPPGQGPNYRFVDIDVIFEKYNLSIDFTEQNLKLSNNFEAERKSKVNTLANKEKALQKKYDEIANNPIPLESEMNAFQMELANFQDEGNKAQQELMEKQMKLEQTQAQNLATIMDSVQNYLKIYGAAKGYDAIFFAAPYYNPALDVTSEVVEGLNARYNKVKK